MKTQLVSPVFGLQVLTIMIRIKDIREGLFHLVGWQQSYDTSDNRLSDDLTQSESGMYFQQAHPLLTLDNLESIAPDFDNYQWAKHDPTKSYAQGIVVQVDETLYKAIQVVPENTDITNTEYWIETNPFSVWLADKTKASIVKLINKFINSKLADKASKSLIENKTLFDGTGRLTNLVENKHRLVGFEIDTVRSKGVTVKINKIGLQMTQPGPYKLYIYHSSNPEPIYTLDVIKRKANTIEWFTPQEDILLPYESEVTDAGGSWYLVYKQSELPEGSNAIYKDRDWSTGPCKACSRREFVAWTAWSKYIEIHPFYMSELDEGELFDPEKMVFNYECNYGINLDVSAYCDLTDFIIKQRAAFQDVLSKQVAIDFLREFAFNPNVRTNRRSINASKMDIISELDGDTNIGKSGLSQELEVALKALNISTQGLDRVCLPCVNNGIKYRTV